MHASVTLQGFHRTLESSLALTPHPTSHMPRIEQFLDLCLLTGCDYITTSIKGLGIATAHKLVDRHRRLDRVRSLVFGDTRGIHMGHFIVLRSKFDPTF